MRLQYWWNFQFGYLLCNRRITKFNSPPNIPVIHMYCMYQTFSVLNLSPAHSLPVLITCMYSRTCKYIVHYCLIINSLQTEF